MINRIGPIEKDFDRIQNEFTSSKLQTKMNSPLTPPTSFIDNRFNSMQRSNHNEDQSETTKFQEMIPSCLHPTVELSPTSLTSSSSSPDLSNVHSNTDEFLLTEINIEQQGQYHSHENLTTIKYRHRSLSLPLSCSTLKISSREIFNDKSKSVLKSFSLNSQKSTNISKKTPLKRSRSNSNARKVRRRKQEKQFQIDQEQDLIIEHLLNELVEAISKATEFDEQLVKICNPIVVSNICLSNCSNQNNQISINSSTIASESHLIQVSTEKSRLKINRSRKKKLSNDSKQELLDNQLFETNEDQHIKKSKKIRQRNSSISSNEQKRSFSISENNDRNEFSSTKSLSLVSIHSFPSLNERFISKDQTQMINCKKKIFINIIHELIGDGKGLEKLSISTEDLIDSMENFSSLSMNDQNEKLHELEKDLEKKCSLKLQRAILFYEQKLRYLSEKDSIENLKDFLNEMKNIIKYFYLFILNVNYQKQDTRFQRFLSEIIRDPTRFVQDEYESEILTDIISNFILKSSFANEYLGAQSIVIDHIEIGLPLIKNIDLENSLLHANDMNLDQNPFVNTDELISYLNQDSSLSVQQINSSSNFQSIHQRNSQPDYTYYPTIQTSDNHSYYHTPTFFSNYSNPYHHPYNYQYSTSSSNPILPYRFNFNNEQTNYYYENHFPSIYSQSNSPNDIPVNNMNSLNQFYRSTQDSTQK